MQVCPPARDVRAAALIKGVSAANGQRSMEVSVRLADATVQQGVGHGLAWVRARCHAAVTKL
ncbi:hypothetical protein B2J77_12065 [Pseudomonas parafulva]|uniref:Uncharacterized protein n=1 Tax=Pseudomonas parafulva TaxID=157782 RepID=A0AAJ0PGR6_9PSED|nr:hypothetical protein B2J77_12065 [Pseudomonas parafulva]KTT19866.1 hypothetical protein NS96R_01685 [Pseudomonas parafulva]